MEKIKVAIIGTGSISGEHIKAYQKLDNVELYAFCDINEARLNKKGKKYGVTRLYTDEAQMLRELPELDAVSICTWNAAHAPCAIMALDAGKHVLCEKPMATSLEEAIAMQEAARRNNRLLMIGFVRRFGHDCEVIRDLINEDALGELYYAKVAYLRRHGNPGGWFGDKAFSGGGPLIDIGVHVIDLARYLFGNPKPVSVYGATFSKLGARKHIKSELAYVSSSTETYDCNCEDLVSAMVRFDNGAVLSVEASFDANLKDNNRIQLLGTKAGVCMDDGLHITTEYNGYLADVELDAKTELKVDDAFFGEIKHFVDCIADEGKTCICPAEDGVALMQILTAIYRSAESGHEEVIEA